MEKSHADRPSLDPEDWQAYRALAHRVLDETLDMLQHVRDRRVWTPVPDAVKARYAEPLPMEPREVSQLCQDVTQLALPYATGNIHPRFFGWVQGTGTVGGMLACMYSAAMNANCGGRDHGAVYMERQVLAWCRDIFGFPAGSSGLLVSGTSMATLLGLTVARNQRAGVDVRQDGLRGAQPLAVYTSEQAHVSVIKAVEMLGLGRAALRRIPVDSDHRMDLQALQSTLAEDRAAGVHPVCVVATAGTVNTGAFDDIEAIANLCQQHRVWLHVDGAFGAMVRISDQLKGAVRGIDRADSLAFDFHKWLHVQYDAGCVLVRDGSAHLATFSTHTAYLARAQRGLAGAQPWFCDFGPELSREFRAMRVWFTLKEHGVRRLAEKIEDNCAQARVLAARVQREAELELVCAVALNIVCFRYRAALSEAALDQLNEDIVADLHESGIAVPSTTVLNGKRVIRVCITNHRTRREDMDRLVEGVLDMGRRRVKAG